MTHPPFLSIDIPWIDQTLDRLSLEQQIAQLLHVPSWSNRSEIHFSQVIETIEEHQVGGVIFFQGDPLAQLRLTERYHAAANVPLMISIDAEWGLAMRLEETVQYPYQMALGAISELELIEEMGAQLGRQCRRLGVHVNFAPCVDINVEPNNPVIGFRSFGSSPTEVGRLAAQYMKGLQSEKVLAVAKHFPGHGDTAVDSHLDLPILPYDTSQLYHRELMPFEFLMKQGIGGMMTGHLHVPAFDTDPRIGATLSHNLATLYLQKQMGFGGLVFTDALDMKGVTKHFSSAEINLRALLAGHDVMLFCTDVPGSIQAIVRAIEEEKISETEIRRRCRKLLQAKAWLGLNEAFTANYDNLVKDLNPAESIELNQQLADQAITIVKGEPHIPLKEDARVACLSIFSDYGEDGDALAHHQLTKTNSSEVEEIELTPLQRILSTGNVDQFVLDLKEPETMQKWVVKAMREYETVIVSIHGLHIKASHGFGITESLQHRLTSILNNPNIILLVFGSAYVLDKLHEIGRAQAILLAYQDSPFMQKAAANVLLGRIPALGKLPVKLRSANLVSE